jgi:hypothetical protein
MVWARRALMQSSSGIAIRRRMACNTANRCCNRVDPPPPRLGSPWPPFGSGKRDFKKGDPQPPQNLSGDKEVPGSFPACGLSIDLGLHFHRDRLLFVLDPWRVPGTARHDHLQIDTRSLGFGPQCSQGRGAPVVSCRDWRDCAWRILIPRFQDGKRALFAGQAQQMAFRRWHTGQATIVDGS